MTVKLIKNRQQLLETLSSYEGTRIIGAKIIYSLGMGFEIEISYEKEGWLNYERVYIPKEFAYEAYNSFKDAMKCSG